MGNIAPRSKLTITNSVIKNTSMKKLLLICIGALSCVSAVLAQTGNTGFGTSTPGSKLTVSGSFAAAYTSTTANAYTAGENDFYIVWNGTAAGTITLPASTSGPDRIGRLYFFKNTSAIYTLTIDADGTELIDNAQTVVLQPGETALLVKTNINTASGVTYEVVQIAKNQPPYQFAATGNSAQSFLDGSGASLPVDFTAIEFSTNGGADFNLTSNSWTCSQAGTYRIQTEALTVTPSSSSFLYTVIRKNGVNVGLAGHSVFTVNNTGVASVIVSLVPGDQITAHIHMCGGCGAPSVSSTFRRLEIVRL
jgi:hypothetical protein